MSITLRDTSIVLDTEMPWQEWCCYEHHVRFDPDEPAEVVLVGVTRLAELYRFNEARLNNEWQRIFSKGGHVMIKIIATSRDKRELLAWASHYMRQMDKMPRCNLHGMTTRGMTRPIRCENTGEIFPSQKDVCLAMGIHASQMSLHLTGRAKSIRGMQFRYVSPEVDEGEVRV